MLILEAIVSPPPNQKRKRRNERDDNVQVHIQCHLNRLSPLHHHQKSKSIKNIILYVCFGAKYFVVEHLLQRSTLPQKSQFRILVATFDQEQQGREWNVDDFGMWLNSNPQLRNWTRGWDLLGLWDGLKNEGLFMNGGGRDGRAAPALFEIVATLKVCLFFLKDGSGCFF